LNSLIGVAHEVAAQADQPVKRDFQNEDSKPVDVGGAKAATQAAVHDIELAPRYMLALLTVDPKLPSPQWLKDRLQAQGVRSISAVVDVTNYVMLEYGQPLHAFDAAKIEGQIQVRRARKGEKLTTLDGVDRTLTDEDIVIADEKQALGLAGVMGGANSEIDDSTTEVLLEAASFNPVALRKTAVRYGLRTDASARFERGLPIELQPYGLFAAIQLLQEHAGGKLITNPADVVKNTEPQSVIEVQNQRVNKLLGLELSGQEMQKELKKLNFESQASEGEDSFKVTIPWWRPDVTHEADIAEEVIKLVGHDKLPSTIPSLRRQTMQFDQRWAPLWNAKDVLRSLGLFEVSTYSFIGEHLIDDLGFKADMHFKLKNPLSSEQAYLRRTLLPSLLATAEKNRNYNKNFGMFEFSRTFWKQGEGELPVEPTYLGVITVVQDGAYASVKRVLDRLTREFKVELEIKPGAFHPVAAHPTRSAQLLLNGDQVGICGQLHPALVRKKKISGEVGFLELDWPRFVAASKPVAARPLSRYPQITRDIAVLVDRGVLWRDVAHELADYQPEFLNDYYGEDLPKHQKSLALRLTFGAEDHTLTDAEADNLEQQVIKRLQQKFNAVLR
jgi:phenylalanyl-tRNA synthetase beta chain